MAISISVEFLPIPGKMILMSIVLVFNKITQLVSWLFFAAAGCDMDDLNFVGMKNRLMSFWASSCIKKNCHAAPDLSENLAD